MCCTGLVSETSQDLSLVECDIVLDSLLKTSVTVPIDTALLAERLQSVATLLRESAVSNVTCLCCDFT